MPATKDTVNNRIQLGEGTRANPKTLAQIVTDINDATWIESFQGGAVIIIKRSIFSNGFWLEYSNYVHAILENGCHWLQHTAGGGVIHRPFSRWETKNAGSFSHTGTQALRAGTFVMESAIDGTKPEMINSGGGRYDYPTTALISGSSYHAVAYEISGASVIGALGQMYSKMLGTAGSLFNKMSFIGNAFFELFPNNTYNGLLSYNTGFSLINGGSSGTVAIPNWTVVSATNYPIGSYVDSGGVTYTVLITDLTNGGAGVWNGAFAYNAAPNQATTILRHSVLYTFATGTVPISGVKVAIVNTATVGTAQAQTVLTTNGQGIASGFAVRAQGVGNTVNLRQQQRIFSRGLTHDVPHVQLMLQELTAPINTPVQGVLSSLYGASEVVSGGALTNLTLNYTTKTINTTAPMTAAELYDSCRWSLYQDASLTQADFLGLSTATTTHIGDWSMTGAQITGNVTATGTISNTVTGVKVDANNAGAINVTGLGATDTAEMRLVSNGSLIASRTGSGALAVSPANVGASVYFRRLVGTELVMSTITAPVTLTAGVNPEVPLYAGAEVQVAQAARIDLLPTAAEVWAYNIEPGHSAQDLARLSAAVLVGKVSGAGTGTETFRDVNDTKDRVISSVDANGNRTGVTKDGT